MKKPNPAVSNSDLVQKLILERVNHAQLIEATLKSAFRIEKMEAIVSSNADLVSTLENSGIHDFLNNVLLIEDKKFFLAKYTEKTNSVPLYLLDSSNEQA